MQESQNKRHRPPARLSRSLARPPSAAPYLPPPLRSPSASRHAPASIAPLLSAAAQHSARASAVRSQLIAVGFAQAGELLEFDK